MNARRVPTSEEIQRERRARRVGLAFIFALVLGARIVTGVAGSMSICSGIFSSLLRSLGE
jgi:hypothetical protein